MAIMIAAKISFKRLDLFFMFSSPEFELGKQLFADDPIRDI